jgi:hypothetical protein
MTSKYAPLFIVVFALCGIATAAEAQSAPDRHPLLEDRFILDGGFFVPNKEFRLRVDGTIPGQEIDFGDGVDTSTSETSGQLNFRWKFGEKWSVAGQYFKTSESGTATIEDEIVWEDVIYEAGASVTAGYSFDVARVFFGRKVSSGDKHEIGLGAGLHWLEIGAFIEGEAYVGDDTTQFQRRAVDAGAPLPNVGAWYWHAFSPRWLFRSRLDWFGASFGDYSGDLWNAAVGINYQPWRHFGLGLSYQFFKLSIDVDKSDWKGATNLTYHGPFVSLSTSW